MTVLWMFFSIWLIPAFAMAAYLARKDVVKARMYKSRPSLAHIVMFALFDAAWWPVLLVTEGVLGVWRALHDA